MFAYLRSNANNHRFDCSSVFGFFKWSKSPPFMVSSKSGLKISKPSMTRPYVIPPILLIGLSTLGSIIGATILVAILEPYFLLAVAFVLTLYAHNAQFYRRSARECKRIDSILRSSLYSHFSLAKVVRI